MDFLTSIANARAHTVAAIRELGRYDHAALPTTPHNMAVVDTAIRHVSPGATVAGGSALDASRWERWVTIRQIRDTGTALELLDRAWWGLNGRGGAPDAAGARRTLNEAVSMLDRATQRWAVPARAVPWAVSA